MTKPQSAGAARDNFSNILRNLGWLLGGKGFAAVASLGYLAILSRSLGVKDFGHFSLIFGTAQTLVALAGFETWQSIVRFGARYVVGKDWASFGRLIWLCIAIDFAGALMGCLFAYIAFFGFNEVLNLNPDYVEMGFWFSCALLWARLSTPYGIVRVLDRFDLGTYVEAIVPAGRLIAASAILVIGPSVELFVIAWATIDLFSAAVLWIVSWILVPDAISRKNFGQWSKSTNENEGIFGFFGVTYAAASLNALTKQGPLLAVGYLLGTSAAGIYRLADQLAQSIGKFSQIVGRAVFPEFVHSQIGTDAASFGRLFRRVTIIAGAGGFAVTLAAFLFGGPLLEFIGGDAFSSGVSLLVPLAIGASFELASVSYEPMFFAVGRAQYPLIVRSLGVVAMGGAILLFVGSGPTGVAWAVCLGMGFAYALMSLLAWMVLREMARADGAT